MSAAASLRGMKLGAEPKKLAMLGGLLAVVVGVLVYNSTSTDVPSNSRGASSVSQPAASSATALTPARQARAHRRVVRKNSDRNSLRMQEVTVEAQQGAIDPTLRLDLLARLKNVALGGGTRSLFEPGAAPAVITAKNQTIIPGPVRPVVTAPAMQAPQAPQAAPITLKFYGFSAPSTPGGQRRGFFLDGDEILIANEGELVKGRYLIVSLQPKSAEVEDSTTKNRQSLPIVPEQQQGAF